MPQGNTYPAPNLPLSGTETLTIFQQQSGVVKTFTATTEQLAAFINGYVPTTATAPSGAPGVINGAPVLYNTTSHTLNIYDPVAAAWYHVALTAGGA